MELNEYEFFLDIRKFLKLSLSFILYLTIQEILLNKGREFPLNRFYDKGLYGLALDKNINEFGKNSYF
jgi:hypothetical protein